MTTNRRFLATEGTPENPILLVQISAKIPTSLPAPVGTTLIPTTIYLSDRQGFRNQNAISTGPFQIPQFTTHLTRVQKNALLTLDLIQAWAKSVAQLGIGELSLVNTDGALDAWADYVFDGGTVKVALGTLDAAGNLSVTLLFQGTMEQPDIGLRDVRLPIRTGLYLLDRPILSQTFAGTGGTNPPEGAADLKGKLKPKAYGIANNIPLIPVDAANLIYFASLGKLPLHGGNGVVYDSGLPLTPPVFSFTTMAALYAATVTAGSFAVCYRDNGSGVTLDTYVKLGQLPVGQLTATGITDISMANDPSAIIAQLLTDSGLGTPSLSDFYQGLTPGQGLYLDDTTTYATAMAQLATGVLGWVWFAPVGYRSSPTNIVDLCVISQFPGTGNPSIDFVGNTLAVVNPSDIIDIRKIGNPKTPGDGVPFFEVALDVNHNPTVQASGLAATVGAQRRVQIGQEYARRASTDASTLSAYPLAESLLFQAAQGSRGVDLADPAGNLDNMLELFRWAASIRNPQWYQITVRLTKALQQFIATGTASCYWCPATMPSYKGACLGIRSPRFRFTTTGNGVQFFPMAISTDLDKRQITYTGWTTFQPG